MRAAAVWYEEARSGLGEQFLHAIEASMRLIEERPLAWRRIGRRLHRVLVRRFPFAIVYHVADEMIRIVAVMHVKRRPGYWRSRLKP